MKAKIYIDGSEGTTGLRINERFQGRDDIEILRIPEELRKDVAERKKYINASDITFLCLPDAAAMEAVSLVENEHVKIIDASTAHRTNASWAYGFPELGAGFRAAIRDGKRVAVPGCHASGFMALAYPLVKSGIISSDFPVTSYSITGYSGGGKGMIAEYEGADRNVCYDAPREYALTQQHKHLKEMKAIAGLDREPLFTPIVADYYSGMIVNLPLYGHMIGKTRGELLTFFQEYYAGEAFIRVLSEEDVAALGGFMSGNGCDGWDGMEIAVMGNDERILLAARFDNLGKGASAAAVQCMNIMLGCDEKTGLSL